MFHDVREREGLRREIEDTIRRFEPRFSSLRVHLIASDDKLDTTLRLRIDALLVAEPTPEPVVFDTVVDAATSSVIVRSMDDV
jgi:type VI secretion system protein ImpF